MDRRRFVRAWLAVWGLALGGCGAADTRAETGSRAGAAPAACLPTVDAPADGARRVVVVGVGMAGLAAARELQAWGDDVVVIEARDRPGGRTWTSAAWPDLPLDLGASWIHGVDGNPMTDLAALAGARLVPIDLEANRVFSSFAGEIADATLAPWRERLESIISDAQDADDDASIYDTVAASLDWDALADTERWTVLYLLNSMLEHEYAGSIERLSTYWYDDAGEYGGGDAFLAPGYGAIVDLLASGLTIEYQQPVRQIRWDDAGVTVVSAGRQTRWSSRCRSACCAQAASGSLRHCPAGTSARSRGWRWGRSTSAISASPRCSGPPTPTGSGTSRPSAACGPSGSAWRACSGSRCCSASMPPTRGATSSS
jgi:hypothetical protein